MLILLFAQFSILMTVVEENLLLYFNINLVSTTDAIVMHKRERKLITGSDNRGKQQY